MKKSFFSIETEVTNAEVVRMGLEDLGAEFARIGRLRLFRFLQDVRKRITKPPPKYRGPGLPEDISEDQLRYLHFAAGRGLIDIPYERSGAYRRSWKILKAEDGYVLQGGGYWLPGTGMRVGQPAAVYVGGDIEGFDQSWMHRGRWTLVADAIEEGSEILQEDVSQVLGVTARLRGYPWE